MVAKPPLFPPLSLILLEQTKMPGFSEIGKPGLL